MKAFGKVLIGLGAFAAGTYAGAFISAYVAEKVMDSPLDELVLRKHAGHNYKSNLGYLVIERPKSCDDLNSAGKEDSDEEDSYDEDAAEDESDDDFNDSNSVPTYYESLELFLNDDQIVSAPWGTKVHIKMQSGNVVEYRRVPSGWVSSKLSASSDYIAIHYGELNDDIAYDFYNPHNGDYLLGVSADAKTYCIYRWADNYGLYYYGAEDKTSPYLPDSEFASDESDDDKSTYYDSLLAFLKVSNSLFSNGEKVRIKMKDGVVLRYARNNDGWVLDSAVPDPNHISGIFYGDINLINFNHYNFHEGDLILNIPFVEDAFEKAKLYKWHNGEVINTGIMIDRSDEDDSYEDNDIIFANYKGPVKTFADLPKNPEIGDTFLVEDADNGKGCIYAYTKRGYVIPDKTDGVSLNDLFRFNMDAHQDDTDSDITTDTVSNS